MEDKSTLSLVQLSKRLEQIHSTIIAVTAAMESGCGNYKPAELVPSLECLVDQTYALAKETREAVESGMSFSLAG